MRYGVRCVSLLSATRRSADRPVALIRPSTFFHIGQASPTRLSAYSPKTHPVIASASRAYTMSSSADQPQAPPPEASSSAAAKTGPELPPLSPQEFRQYNRLAETMDYFHDHFRKSWKLLYTACCTGKRPGNMTLKQFIDEGISLVRYLETHHGIEETYFFPLLAKKMPEFRPGGGKSALLEQHKQIHAGMDVFVDYLRRCRSGETEFELGVLKEKMDVWGDVLHRHLDQEVATLGAENMRRYWTVQEIRQMPI